jgi:multisubunit Na+/H+ antiporter MnhF subunit
LLFGGGLLLLRAPDTLHRVLALDVLVAILIVLADDPCPTCATSRTTSTPALALALLALTSTLVAARYVTRGGPF